VIHSKLIQTHKSLSYSDQQERTSLKKQTLTKN